MQSVRRPLAAAFLVCLFQVEGASATAAPHIRLKVGRVQDDRTQRRAKIVARLCFKSVRRILNTCCAPRFRTTPELCPATISCAPFPPSQFFGEHIGDWGLQNSTAYAVIER